MATKCDRNIPIEKSKLSPIIFATFSEREFSIIQFEVWRFMHDGLSRATAAAQDKEGRYFKKADCEKFFTDVEDAEKLVGKLRALK